MKKLNITEQELDKVILETVKKHLNEQHDTEGQESRVQLILNYLTTASRHLMKVKEILDHPDAEYMLEDEENQHLFDTAVSLMETAKDLHAYLKSELGVHIPKAEFDAKKYKEIAANKKAFSMSENKIK